MEKISELMHAAVTEMRAQGVTRFAAVLDSATVQVEIQQYLCLDGRPFHDMKGQTVCPSCGFAPKIAS